MIKTLLNNPAIWAGIGVGILELTKLLINKIIEKQMKEQELETKKQLKSIDSKGVLSRLQGTSDSEFRTDLIDLIWKLYERQDKLENENTKRQKEYFDLLEEKLNVEVEKVKLEKYVGELEIRVQSLEEKLTNLELQVNGGNDDF